ncbi:Elongation of very long chain fatty acids protein, partial [Gryllus bimaculatus]
ASAVAAAEAATQGLVQERGGKASLRWKTVRKRTGTDVAPLPGDDDDDSDGSHASLSARSLASNGEPVLVVLHIEINRIHGYRTYPTNMSDLKGGHGTFSNLINNIVHVIMYFYYMMAAMGPEYHKYLWWKRHLTTLQLVQFGLVFVHSAQVLFFDCGYPKLVAALLLLHSVIFFGLFFDFYQQAYKKRD